MNSSLLRRIRTRGSTEQGFLSFFESGNDVPFTLNVSITSTTSRRNTAGMHAHKTLQQLLWCPTERSSDRMMAMKKSYL